MDRADNFLTRDCLYLLVLCFVVCGSMSESKETPKSGSASKRGRNKLEDMHSTILRAFEADEKPPKLTKTSLMRTICIGI